MRYEININSVKGNRFLYKFLMFFGLFSEVITTTMVIGACLPLIITSGILPNFDSVTTSISGEVIREYDSEDQDYNYSAKYQYEVDGRHFECESIMSSDAEPGIETVNIHYNSQNPSECVVDDALDLKEYKTILIIFCSFALIPLIFIAMAVMGLRKNNKILKNIETLQQSGSLIKGLDCRIEDAKISVNDRRMYHIAVDYTSPMTGQLKTFRSEARFIDNVDEVSKTADLLIDRQNPDVYFVDFEIKEK